MSIVLSSADIERLRGALTTLAAPFSFEGIGEWRAACRSAVESLVGVERSGFVLHLEGEPLISCGEELAAPAVAWERHYHRLDIGLTQTRRERGLEVFHVLDLYDREALVRTELYNDWQRPHRLDDALAMAIDLVPGLPPASLHCYNDRPDPDFRERGYVLLGLLLPAFRAGLEMLRLCAAHRARLVEYLEQTPEGVMIVDLTGRVLHRTPALRRLLEEDPAGAPDLEGAMHESARLLAGLLVSSGRRGEPPGHGPVWRSVRTSRRAYQIRTTIFRSETVGGDPLLVTVLAPQGERTLSDVELRERYGLTARETAVARRLATGGSSTEIAASLGISPHTVRRHTERIFSKLGIRSRVAVRERLRHD